MPPAGPARRTREVPTTSRSLPPLVPIGLLFAALLPLALAGISWTAPKDRFVAPPGAESAEITSLIDRAASALKAGGTVSDLLSDPGYLPAHAWPRFRELIRGAAADSSVTIVTPHEPGEPLNVSGVVRWSDGRPVPGALVYAYQTSAKGWYSDRAAHVGGMSGDTRHARLFGYLRSGEDGSWRLRTIRPAGYPGSDLPAHIHLHVEPPGAPSRTLVTEILFEDDPRLTPPARERATREGFLICAVTRDGGGAWHLRADLTIRSEGR